MEIDSQSIQWEVSIECLATFEISLSSLTMPYGMIYPGAYNSINSQ